MQGLNNQSIHHLCKLIAIFLLALFSTLTSTHSLADQDAVLIQAEKLIRQTDYKAAYQLLEPLESTRAGEIQYDYLLGIAGVESGNVTRGAFALERVLAVDPNHQDARAEMAKAHFLLGERDTAKQEFNYVLGLEPVAQTKRTVEKLLNAIEKIEGTTTTFGAYLDFGLGWDSNVSSAPSISSISVPLFGGLAFALGNNAQEQSDNFMNLAAGISFRQPINEQLAVFGAVNGANRINGSETDFDNSALDFNGGLQLKLDKNSISFAVQDNHFDLNGESFRRAYGATAQWIHNIDNSNQAGIYAQYTRLNYAGNDIRNAARSIIGINAAHVFQSDLNPVVFASIYGGREEARDSSADFFSQDIVGARAGGQVSFNNKWQLFSSVGAEFRRNDEADPAFLIRRHDDQYDATLGLRYVPATDWSIRPQLSYIKNDSNIDLNTFERKVISVNVRKDFRW
ncbi:MAG: surface lipoprotein assembly modifier [Pseudomonadota bacterium]